MPVGVTDQVIKDGRVDDVQEQPLSLDGMRLLHLVAVGIIFLPPGMRRSRKNVSNKCNLPSSSTDEARIGYKLEMKRNELSTNDKRRYQTAISTDIKKCQSCCRRVYIITINVRATASILRKGIYPPTIHPCHICNALQIVFKTTEKLQFTHGVCRHCLQTQSIPPPPTPKKIQFLLIFVLIT